MCCVLAEQRRSVFRSFKRVFLLISHMFAQSSLLVDIGHSNEPPAADSSIEESIESIGAPTSSKVTSQSNAADPSTTQTTHQRVENARAAIRISEVDNHAADNSVELMLERPPFSVDDDEDSTAHQIGSSGEPIYTTDESGDSSAVGVQTNGDSGDTMAAASGASFVLIDSVSTNSGINGWVVLCVIDANTALDLAPMLYIESVFHWHTLWCKNVGRVACADLLCASPSSLIHYRIRHVRNSGLSNWIERLTLNVLFDALCSISRNTKHSQRCRKKMFSLLNRNCSILFFIRCHNYVCNPPPDSLCCAHTQVELEHKGRHSLFVTTKHCISYGTIVLHNSRIPRIIASALVRNMHNYESPQHRLFRDYVRCGHSWILRIFKHEVQMLQPYT